MQGNSIPAERRASSSDMEVTQTPRNDDHVESDPDRPEKTSRAPRGNQKNGNPDAPRKASNNSHGTTRQTKKDLSDA